MNETSYVRLDQWLWAARFFKTRRLSTDAVRRGHVTVNKKMCKPSKNIGVGDELIIRKENLMYAITIIDLATKRLPSPAAKALYIESNESIINRQLAKDRRRLSHAPSRRPDREQRRQLTRLKKTARP